jgi:small-conductance mechanosensitive channel
VESWWSAVFTQGNQSAAALIGAVLAAAAVAHWALSRWAHRAYERSDPTWSFDGRVRDWVSRGLRHVVPPLALLIWVHGLFVVLRVLLARSEATAGYEVALAWAYRLSLVAGMYWLLRRIGGLADEVLVSIAKRTAGTWDDLLLPLAGSAIRRGLPLLALILARPIFSASPALAAVVGDATSLLLIGMVSYLLYQLVDGSAAFVLRQHRIDVSDNLQARAIYTQVTVLKKVAVAAIAVFTLASMLMVFDSVRQFGASILASAGLAGIVVGFAAQRSIATLLAGFQIAMTQPIRVDDVVIVEGEWGRIEDISLTYVVVRIWDLRRLVVPITYFIEKPFQNWTRSSSDILGTVFLHVDYTMPIEPLRQELTRILAASKQWDGRVNVLQVTEARERTVEVRALASAADASLAWDLRCEVREQLVAFVQANYPESLPRFRASFDEPAAAREAGAPQ